MKIVRVTTPKKISFEFRMRCPYNFRKRLFMWYRYKRWCIFWIKSYDYSMAVLYPKIVSACTKFAQNYGYYKRSFSVLPRKHHTLLAKNAWNPYSLGMAKLVWPYQESAFFASRVGCFLIRHSKEFGISALLFWHICVHAKFPKMEWWQRQRYYAWNL